MNDQKPPSCLLDAHFTSVVDGLTFKVNTVLKRPHAISVGLNSEEIWSYLVLPFRSLLTFNFS